MVVRKLTARERFEANMISAIAFHQRMEDPEKKREEWAQETTEDWGAFTDDGKMMARILHYRFEAQMDGQLIPNGGIGAVSTLPEYRNTGAIRSIFNALLPEAYRSGEVISTLYPFNHAFYRKFGYETVRWRNDYEFEPSVLSGYCFSGSAELRVPGKPVSEYTELYRRFAKEFNLAIHRDDARMLKDHIQGEYYRDRKFCYLLRQGSQPVAYLIFQDIRHDPAAILSVLNLAWDGKEGLYAILGFLARFTADYGTVKMFLPSCLELLSVIQGPRVYDIHQTARQDYMIRAVNAKKLLEVMKKPENSSFIIRVQGDGQIQENNGSWEVSGTRVLPTDKAPDLTVSIQALGQMAAGCVSLDEASYRQDVSIAGNVDTLRDVFIRKPILVEDFF